MPVACHRTRTRNRFSSRVDVKVGMLVFLGMIRLAIQFTEEPFLQTTTGILASAVISASLIASAFAQSVNPKSASSLSHVPKNIDSPNGKAIFDEEMNGSTRQDGFGTALPNGVAAEDVVRLILPTANPSLATLVGMKHWPHGNNKYVAFVCIAPHQLSRERAIQYNNGKPLCCPWQVGAVPGRKPGECEAVGDYLMAVGMLQLDTEGHLSLASTVVKWSGIEGGPLGTNWQHSNLFGPGGINHWKDKESEKLKSEQFFPVDFYKFDFAKYAITKGNVAFGIRSGMNESYSGGGANFQILTLFAVIDGELRVVFSEPMYYLKDIAGRWNKDGTRNHGVYEGENTVGVSNTMANGYFKLIVRSREKPWHKTFRWDPNVRRYVASGRDG